MELISVDWRMDINATGEIQMILKQHGKSLGKLLTLYSIMSEHANPLVQINL